jgi:hypothetical protein
MEQLLIVLLLWISQHSDFDYHESMGLPLLQQVSQLELAHIYVGDDISAQGFINDEDKTEAFESLMSSLEAVYAADKNTIYLGERVNLESSYGRSIVVHELIHFLQNVHQHHVQVNCGNALEKDAYFIQADYMRAHKLVPPFTEFTVRMRSLCEEEMF